MLLAPLSDDCDRQASNAHAHSDVSVTTSASAYEQREHVDSHIKGYSFEDELVPVALRFLFSLKKLTSEDEVDPAMTTICERFGARAKSVTAIESQADGTGSQPVRINEYILAPAPSEVKELSLEQWATAHSMRTASTSSAAHVSETKIRDACIEYLKWRMENDSSAPGNQVPSCVVRFVSECLEGFWTLSDALTRFEDASQLSPRQETRLNTKINCLHIDNEKLQASLSEVEKTLNIEVHQWRSRCIALEAECDRLRRQKRVEDWVERSLLGAHK